jgi:hypothetical protein
VPVSTSIQYNSRSFLSNPRNFKAFLKQNLAIVAKNIAGKISQQPGQVKCTRREYQAGVQKVYDEINPVFERVFNVNVPLEKALTTLQTLNIQTSRSATERKRERREQLRKAKTSIEKHWKSTSVMRYVC